mmetsp:Transcript_77586/g.140018  ORF Transcript_77586/g.140018 Transcript_77586/m.140018 type:complete len:295 (+) Transcript_77586:102-986(+)
MAHLQARRFIFVFVIYLLMVSLSRCLSASYNFGGTFRHPKIQQQLCQKRCEGMNDFGTLRWGEGWIMRKSSTCRVRTQASADYTQVNYIQNCQRTGLVVMSLTHLRVGSSRLVAALAVVALCFACLGIAAGQHTQDAKPHEHKNEDHCGRDPWSSFPPAYSFCIEKELGPELTDGQANDGVDDDHGGEKLALILLAHTHADDGAEAGGQHAVSNSTYDDGAQPKQEFCVFRERTSQPTEKETNSHGQETACEGPPSSETPHNPRAQSGTEHQRQVPGRPGHRSICLLIAHLQEK